MRSTSLNLLFKWGNVEIHRHLQMLQIHFIIQLQSCLLKSFDRIPLAISVHGFALDSMAGKFINYGFGNKLLLKIVGQGVR